LAGVHFFTSTGYLRPPGLHLPLPAQNMKPEKKPTRWQKTRKFFTDIHLWLGLGSGLIVIAICFSGTVYVFNTEIREASLSELYETVIPANATTLSLEELIAKTEAKTGGKVTSLKTYTDPERTWQLSVKMPIIHVQDDKKEEPRPINYRVDPYTGEIKGDASNAKNITSEFMGSMFSLHRWLLLDRIEEPIFGELPNRKLGSYISGTATILFTLGCITGLVIWVPNKIKNWKQGLKIKWDGNWKRINHDIHNSLAFYSLILLLLMGLTGPQWSFPWYRTGMQKTLGTYKPEDAPKPAQPKSTLPLDSLAKSLTASTYLVAAQQALPGEGDFTINLPDDSAATVSISKLQTGFFAPAASDRLQLDQYTAEVLKVDIFKEKPFNERVASSIKAIHVGDVYGKFSKILYFIACLIATTLPVTGTIIWLNKLKKKRAKVSRGIVAVSA
jgi:uncharacterized iron-regulated membrane protein